MCREEEQAAAQGGGDKVRGGLEEEVSAHAGVVLLMETGRRSGVMEKADRVLPAKKNPKGLGQGQMVESFIVLSALGGECLEDFGTLRADAGFEAMVGYELPAPSTAAGEAAPRPARSWSGSTTRTPSPSGPLKGTSYSGSRRGWRACGIWCGNLFGPTSPQQVSVGL